MAIIERLSTLGQFPLEQDEPILLVFAKAAELPIRRRPGDSRLLWQTLQHPLPHVLTG